MTSPEFVAVLACLLCAGAVLLAGCTPEAEPVTIRVATYNLEDVRTTDLRDPAQPRLQAAAAILQQLRPDVVLLNEIAYDQPGAPGYAAGEAPGQNGRRFVGTFLAVSQGEGLAPLPYQVFAAPTNTGLASGFDLDNDGAVVDTLPVPPGAGPDGTPGPQTPGGRAYGNDSWGFGTFPGQYGMVLLVREGLEILEADVRTFQALPWSRMPGALQPVDPETGVPWYDAGEWARVRLSSKSHWDVPVQLANGLVLHVLCSHPTPPAFDGPEQRNRRRNHDEIRLWRDYLDDAAYLEDDAGRAGGLPEDAPFVILGDLNADPDEGSAFDDPVGRLLLVHPRINGAFVPEARPEGQAAFAHLDPDDTARWGLRVDYVLPSADLQVLGGGIWRPGSADAPLVSDHFPVWVDLAVGPASR
jgi:endonuclease/exonuclease/phosphatase family metal-dependent hydrolase